MKEKDYKAINFRIPIDLWSFMKKRSIDENKSLMRYITEMMSEHKKKIEKYERRY